MTPVARHAAAIEVLDRILSGTPAEQALTNWGRASRFAGSGDRAALRDLVFQALRCRRSYAALGGGETGRGLILGSLRAEGIDPASVFTGEGHAPAAIGDEPGHAPEGLEALDCPDWLAPQLQASLGADFAPVMQALRHRAPVFLRVNLARLSREEALAQLAAEGIGAEFHHLASSALEVTSNARKIQNATTYLDGLVELQDAASQAVVAALPLRDGMRVLDHCAGGGGKTLAMAARARLKLYAHDASPGRMRDLTARATRAGVKVALTDNPEKTKYYDLILTDVPCSGSGSWRRDPQGKWALDAARLAQIQQVQAQIMDRAAPMVAPGGVLAYATCSLLHSENAAQVAAFLARHSGWRQTGELRLTPLQGADGFYLALLTRA
ncbi:RsmB/NOP family class I SAM-dependent RNA methyltransferase [Tabrizicola fusiformis]|uniref:RsmB/NOP family class I SAM-dependent RNA methyltransferase n=1 Tax=Tabrizicola sp. SY72 TaxID=2741673 RepID=UPI0015734D2A|nr:RsmB/NOP family class I SAM-dependent RNA methyltransferase [Tabrizicola sp. SY72]NTT86464.1 RsmB/NOP family class I SAM-dependent RNA methyltransferase [Tabrizicola sp. SY72]